MSHLIDPLDSVIQIVTPENISFEYRLSGPFRRCVAYVVDVVLRIAIVIGILLIAVLVFRSQSSFGVFLVALFLLEWGYGGAFETFWNGQTPGKRIMAVRVVSVEGLPINGQQAVLRNILRVVDSFFFFLVGGAAFLLSKRFQRMGDLAAGTMVVLEESHSMRRHYQVPEISEEVADLIPHSFPIDEKLGEAIGSYVSRRAILSGPRRMQLAGILVDSLRTRYEIPENVNADLILCSLYRRFTKD